MAEYDGSIRIGVKVDQENAQKQLENLKNRLASQTLEIGKQAKAAEKLRSKLSEMAQKTGKPEFVQELVTGLAKAEARAAELDQKIKEINAAEPGKISPESSQRMQELLRQMNEADAESDRLRASLSELDLKPTVENQLMEMARELGSTDANVDRLRESMQQTSAQINQAQAAAANASQAIKDMGASAQVSDQHIVDLRKELEELTQRKADLEAAGVGLGFKEYDDTAGRIREIKDELNEYSNSLGRADTKSESWSSRLGAIVKRLGAAITSNAKKSGNAVSRLNKRVTSLGKNRGFEKASKSASSFARRLKEIVKGALFFNIISRALTGLTNQLGKYLTANKDFSAALNGLKSNLMTAFQPIYETVMPALTTLMQGLEAASAKFAAFIATIFGTTASQAQQNAKDLYEQANAEEAVGDAAEDAAKQQKKFLASFDTIEKIGDETTDTKKDKNKDKQKDNLKFDTDFDKVKAPQWLLDFWKVFQDSWDQYGETTMQAFKDAGAAILVMIGEIGAAFMAAWTGGAGLDALNNLQVMLQTILNLVRDIALTFAGVWNSGIGVEIMNNLLGLLSMMFEIIASIAVAFSNIWNNGTGEQVITNILELLDTVLVIIRTIGEAFLVAWNSGAGEAAIQAIADALNAVLRLANSIGQAFIEAWNENDRGIKIWETIINIVQRVFEVIGNLADRIREAWEVNDNGKAIWGAILDAAKIVLDTIDRIVEATARWAEKINFIPLVESIRNMLEKINPVIQIIGDTIADIWETKVLPFFSYVIEEGLPNLLNGLAGVFDYLASHPEILMAITDLVTQFIAAFAFAPVIEGIVKLAKAFDPVVFAITGAIAAVALLVANFQKMNTLERVVGIIGGVTAALGALAVVIFAIQGGAFGVAMGVAALVAGLMMVAAAVGGASKRSYSSSGGSAFSTRSYASAPAYSVANLPHLAEGAVISPNNEFLAVLGDQRAGTNIEAPLSTIEQAVDNVLTRRGLMGGGATKVYVSFTGSLAQLARVLQPEINVETQRLGPDLVGV